MAVVQPRSAKYASIFRYIPSRASADPSISLDYRLSGAGQCARPFHMPPLPRQCRHAESSVNARYTKAIAGKAKPHHRETP